MAALDFPASPTVGQQYAAPNGVTYQWDGAAWVVTGGPPGQLWTGAGATLTPTDQTKRVVVPGPTASGADQAAISIGTRTQKGRLYALPSTDWLGLAQNQVYNGTAWAQDDNTKPSWDINIASDALTAERIPAGGTTATALLTLNNAGNLMSTGAMNAGTLLQVGVNTSWHGAINPFSIAGSPALDLIANTSQFIASRPVWLLRLDCSADVVNVQRQAPSGGTTIIPWQIDSAGNMTIIGATATKASGTTWANPSDPRLKEDIAPYTRGLAEVVQLDPITYRLKADPAGQTCYGFDAAAVQPVFPECVTETTMKLAPDDAEPTAGVLSFDMHPILVALVNAVKELAARVAALEAPAPTHA
jgi:hypothetical protein